MKGDPKSRRELLAASAGVAAASLAGWPLAAAVIDTGPGSSREMAFLDLAAEAEVREGQPLRASAQAPHLDGWLVTIRDLGAVWLVRRQGRIEAFSAVCPHLGCLVDRAEGGGYGCPCHGSRFGPDGARQGGPANSGLLRLPVRIENGRVLVQVPRPA